MEMQQTRLTVEGMSCPSCIEHIRDALSLDGVVNVDVRLSEGVVVVAHEGRLTRARLVAALEASGYVAGAA